MHDNINDEYKEHFKKRIYSKRKKWSMTTLKTVMEIKKMKENCMWCINVDEKEQLRKFEKKRKKTMGDNFDHEQKEYSKKIRKNKAWWL